MKYRFVCPIMFFLVFVVHADSLAKCPSTFMNPISDIAWESIFPLKIGGITIIGSNLEDSIDAATSPICVCPAPPPLFLRIGISVAFWEPVRLIEIVKEPYCFPSIGLKLPNPAPGTLMGSSTSRNMTGGTDKLKSQAHYFIFPIWQMMEMLTDAVCVEHSGFDVAYLTEVDPLWNNDLLAFFLNPEALLFANPVAQMSCMADSVASNAGIPLSPLFWCMGSWGSAYPLSGTSTDSDVTQGSAGLAARMIYKMGRQGMAFDTSSNICAAIPAPIWNKDRYRLQISRPVRGGTVPIGRSDFIWGAGKNPAFSGDDFVWIMFRKRACCAF